ncbi:hypothetical protein JCM30471_11200 [Desulfuromonas carbonis]|uniref:YkgJ family cysteine cluster protein n=1 Tax=Desulfuromonas sp. DDH964 TaxID=1823759 RepID=UPI00078E6558|nr:YkgJ family cysteine cluster protein [Desulfuromonas sp. DDH964]AMV72601.1 hypothetical protein DBW_2261 [Desulfuromonas sp. DDH964]
MIDPPTIPRPAGQSFTPMDWPAFHAELLNEVRGEFSSGTGDQEKIAAAMAMHAKTEAILPTLRQEASLVACGPGCGHCCIVNVAVLEPEALLVAREVNRLPPQQRAKVRERLRKLDWETAGMTDEERLVMQRPCAFLDAAGNCSIHPVRPLLCRKLTSTSAEDCEQARVRAVFGETLSLTADLCHGQVYESAFTALAEGLREAGCDDRSRRLSASVLGLLESNRLTPSGQFPDRPTMPA